MHLLDPHSELHIISFFVMVWDSTLSYRFNASNGTTLTTETTPTAQDTFIHLSMGLPRHYTAFWCHEQNIPIQFSQQLGISDLAAIHGFRTDVVSIGLFEISDLDTAAALWEQGQTKNGKSDGDFLVAWDSSRYNALAALNLSVNHRAPIILAARTTASTWEAGSRWLATNLHAEQHQK
jgi:hypothetical protein